MVLGIEGSCPDWQCFPVIAVNQNSASDYNNVFSCTRIDLQ